MDGLENSLHIFLSPPKKAILPILIVLVSDARRLNGVQVPGHSRRGDHEAFERAEV